MNASFWRDKKVFLTGHTGFKGSWLSAWLQKLGAQVVGFALLPPTEPNMFSLTELGSRMTSLEGDIRDLELLRGAMQQHQPEIVLHLAAQALVRRSYDDPVETYSTNVMGTVHTLQAVAECPSVRVALMITSDKCYDNREWPWGYREIEAMGGADPYSSSKGCAELVTAAYARSFFSLTSPDGRAPTRIASARAGNVIGGGDWATDRLIPDIVRSFSASEKVTIRSPQAIRPWQHVLEPLRGYLMLAEQLWLQGEAPITAMPFGGGWNFGPRETDAQPVAQIVERLAELWGEGASWELDAAVHPHEATYLKLDCSKAHMQLGWRPVTTLETALTWIVEWYRAHRSGQDLHALTLEQISRYEALAA